MCGINLHICYEVQMTFREKLPNLSEILENKKAWVGFFFFSCGEGRRGG